MPKVSAVINAKSRPVEVIHAIRSVLAQSFQDLEILVVVDGLEPATERALAEFQASFASAPFTVLVNPVNVGLAEARNVGVRATTGEYVAFLDDDDEWLPAKIEQQLLVAASLPGRHHFVACRFIEKTGKTEKVWPETLPNGREPFSEFLFVRRGMILPSTFLVSRPLIEEVPFTAGLRHIEDIDWMLRAAAHPGTHIAAAESVLAIYNNHIVNGRESRNFPWYTFYVWSLPHRPLFTPLAYSCFLTRAVVPRAKAAGASRRQLLHLLSAALLLGSFNLTAISSFLFSFFLSQERKAWGRRVLSRQARLATRENAKMIGPR